MVRERGSGITPPRVVELLKKHVSETSMLSVSKETGLGLAAIGRYLKGIGEPTTATLQKLAEYFDESVAQLRGDTIFNSSVANHSLDNIVASAQGMLDKIEENSELKPFILQILKSTEMLDGVLMATQAEQEAKKKRLESLSKAIHLLKSQGPAKTSFTLDSGTVITYNNHN